MEKVSNLFVVAYREQGLEQLGIWGTKSLDWGDIKAASPEKPVGGLGRRQTARPEVLGEKWQRWWTETDVERYKRIAWSHSHIKMSHWHFLTDHEETRWKEVEVEQDWERFSEGNYNFLCNKYLFNSWNRLEMRVQAEMNHIYSREHRVERDRQIKNGSRWKRKVLYFIGRLNSPQL